MISDLLSAVPPAILINFAQGVFQRAPLIRVQFPIHPYILCVLGGHTQHASFSLSSIPVPAHSSARVHKKMSGHQGDSTTRATTGPYSSKSEREEAVKAARSYPTFKILLQNLHKLAEKSQTCCKLYASSIDELCFLPGYDNTVISTASDTEREVSTLVKSVREENVPWDKPDLIDRYFTERLMRILNSESFESMKVIICIHALDKVNNQTIAADIVDARADSVKQLFLTSMTSLLNAFLNHPGVDDFASLTRQTVDNARLQLATLATYDSTGICGNIDEARSAFKRKGDHDDSQGPLEVDYGAKFFDAGLNEVLKKFKDQQKIICEERESAARIGLVFKLDGKQAKEAALPSEGRQISRSSIQRACSTSEAEEPATVETTKAAQRKGRDKAGPAGGVNSPPEPQKRKEPSKESVTGRKRPRKDAPGDAEQPGSSRRARR